MYPYPHQSSNSPAPVTNSQSNGHQQHWDPTPDGGPIPAWALRAAEEGSYASLVPSFSDADLHLLSLNYVLDSPPPTRRNVGVKWTSTRHFPDILWSAIKQISSEERLRRGKDSRGFHAISSVVSWHGASILYSSELVEELRSKRLGGMTDSKMEADETTDFMRIRPLYAFNGTVFKRTLSVLQPAVELISDISVWTELSLSDVLTLSFMSSFSTYEGNTLSQQLIDRCKRGTGMFTEFMSKK